MEVVISSEPDLGDWAALGGAVFTALAALAALFTAWQGRQLIERAQEPRIEMDLSRDMAGNVLLHLMNTGQGTARRPLCSLYAAGKVVEGSIRDFIAGGERVQVGTDIPVPAEQLRMEPPHVAVTISYRDAEGYVHYRTNDGRHQVPKTRWRRQPKHPPHRDMVRLLFPEIDVEDAQPATSQLQPML